MVIGRSPEHSLMCHVINVLATVHDKKGKAVADLSQSDFTLTEDGRPQTIQNFAKAADAPLTLGLLVDTSPNQWHALDQERRASADFLDKLLGETTDKAFLIHFDHEVELLQDLTPSHQKLEKAIASLQVDAARHFGGKQSAGSGLGPGLRSRTGQLRRGKTFSRWSATL
jgi:VWFA-related protein